MALLGAAVIFGLGALMPMSDALKWAFVLMFMLPPPYVLPVYVEDDRENGFVSTTLSLYTVLSLAAFAVIAAMV